MKLADYYLSDPRCVLVAPEHLTSAGMSRELAAVLGARRGWSAARIALFDASFALYWRRSTDLARRTAWWPAPRRRHVVVVDDPLAVRPYVQLLNTSAWLLYADDFDPDRSHAELAAYLLVHGDRMAVSGEIATAPVHTAAWWLERTDAECDAFAAAAARSARPDAAGLQAIAAALPWLRRLRHETLKPVAVASPHRPIPSTGVLVPGDLEAEPPALVARWRGVAEGALARYRARWRTVGAAAVTTLSDWLATDVPPLLVTSHGGRIVWDPSTPRRLGALRAELKQADGAAVERIAADLGVVARHTRAFLDAVLEPDRLAMPAGDPEQRGYTYLHGTRRLIAYNLREPGMERLIGPPLPYERAMLGARTAHEWAHVADASGYVPTVAASERVAALEADLARELDDAVARAPDGIRARTAADLAELAAPGSPGERLTRLLLTRLPDYRANLVARRFMSEVERETYVRHNVRTLRPFYPRARLWRMLVRYLSEYQYFGSHLGLTAIGDPRAYLFDGTWFVQDFVETGVLDEARFDRLVEAVARLCGTFAVDEGRFRPAAAPVT